MYELTFQKTETSGEWRDLIPEPKPEPQPEPDEPPTPDEPTGDDN